MTIRAHFDGRVIVPDELVTLPVNTPLRFQLLDGNHDKPVDALIAGRLERLRTATGIISGPVLSGDALRRENIYAISF